MQMFLQIWRIIQNKIVIALKYKSKNFAFLWKYFKNNNSYNYQITSFDTYVSKGPHHIYYSHQLLNAPTWSLLPSRLKWKRKWHRVSESYRHNWLIVVHWLANRPINHKILDTRRDGSRSKARLGVNQCQRGINTESSYSV